MDSRWGTENYSRETIVLIVFLRFNNPWHNKGSLVVVERKVTVSWNSVNWNLKKRAHVKEPYRVGAVAVWARRDQRPREASRGLTSHTRAGRRWKKLRDLLPKRIADVKPDKENCCRSELPTSSQTKRFAVEENCRRRAGGRELLPKGNADVEPDERNCWRRARRRELLSKKIAGVEPDEENCCRRELLPKRTADVEPYVANCWRRELPTLSQPNRIAVL